MINNKIPNHIAFIMDGNRRWAKKRGLPIIVGHHKGVERIEPLVEQAAKFDIKYITFWAFSSENWKRGEREVGFLMRVFREFIKSSVVKRMMEKDVRVKVIGDIDQFPKDIVDGVRKIVEKSKENKTITATFALNYGGRQEILRAINVILNEVKNPSTHLRTRIRERSFDSALRRAQGFAQDDTVDEKVFSSYLYTHDLPDPDLVVRTGGEARLSGFMPWQTVYSELYFTSTLWPDFSKKEFGEALVEYDKRERRFGE